MPKLKPNHVSPSLAKIDLTEEQFNEIVASEMTFAEIESQMAKYGWLWVTWATAHCVVFTQRSGRRRIISLRKANPREERKYAQA